MNINSLDLYAMCALIVGLLVLMMAFSYSAVRFFWQERQDNKAREIIRQRESANRLFNQRYKYAVYPGYVYSQNDYDKHWISADRLIQLYGVNRRDCLVIREHERGANGEGLIALKPRSDGNYSLPES